MRVPRIILVVLAGALLLFCVVMVGPFIFPSPYLRFMHKDVNYYSQVAHACDLLLQQHPVSSTNSVRLSEHIVLPFTRRLSANDSSLPKVIKSLSPKDILISSNRAFIEVGPERTGGFGIIWQQSDEHTNLWTLQTSGDGLMKTVYSETKP